MVDTEEEKPVCIIDFCGRCGHWYPFQYWAFWWPKQRVVKFGGELYERVPDMPADSEPTEDACEKWISQSGYKFPVGD